MSVSFSHSMTYSLLPYTLYAQSLCHPVRRQSQFRHAYLVDALLSSLHSLWLVIVTKLVIIIVSLFGTHLWLYILHWGGACILTLCLHPKSSVQLKAYSLLTYSYCSFCGSLPCHYLLPHRGLVQNPRDRPHYLEKAQLPFWYEKLGKWDDTLGQYKLQLPNQPTSYATFQLDHMKRQVVAWLAAKINPMNPVHEQLLAHLQQRNDRHKTNHQPSP